MTHTHANSDPAKAVCSSGRPCHTALTCSRFRRAPVEEPGRDHLDVSRACRAQAGPQNATAVVYASQIVVPGKLFATRQSGGPVGIIAERCAGT